MALHEVGSNNPDGIEIKKKKGSGDAYSARRHSLPSYYTVKDIVGVSVFLMVFSAIVFFAPEMGGYLSSKPTTSSRPTR